MEILSFIDQELNANKEALTLNMLPISQAVNELMWAWKKGHIVFTAGCGGSASTAQHLASDLFRGSMVRGTHKLKVLSLVDNVPLVSAYTNDNGWTSVFIEQLKTLMPNKGRSLLIALSGQGDSGRSQNIIEALKYHRANGGINIGLSGNGGGAFNGLCHVNIVVPSSSASVIESVHSSIAHILAGGLRNEIEGTVVKIKNGPK